MLGAGDGMLFPFAPPRAATFHMGQVSFAIDIAFADAAGRVARIVRGALPGTRTRWAAPVCAAVLETAAGGLAQVALGDELRILGRKVGTQTYNLLRTLTEASAPPLAEGYYGEEPRHDPPGARNDLRPEERFRDHRLVDDKGDAMDQPNEHYVENMGYQRPFDTAPTYPLRMGSIHVSDIEMLLSVARVPWQSEVLNAGIVRAFITPEVVGRWTHALNIDDTRRDQLFDEITTGPGLDALGRGFIAAGADIARVFQVGDENVLELTKGK